MAGGGSPRLSTHVLDLARGGPAAGMVYRLYRIVEQQRALLVQGRTNAEGRTEAPLLQGVAFRPGTYELEFDAAAYFHDAGGPAGSIWTTVPIRFVITAEDRHYHIPLLIGPGGYSTYRGN